MPLPVILVGRAMEAVPVLAEGAVAPVDDGPLMISGFEEPIHFALPGFKPPVLRPSVRPVPAPSWWPFLAGQAGSYVSAEWGATRYE